MTEDLAPEIPAAPSRPTCAKRLSLAERLEAKTGRYLGIFTVLYLFAEYCENRHRPFMIDELFTYNLAELPSIRQIWPLIKQGIELNPPLPFWITWMIHHSIGHGEFISRLPAILGYWGMCLCLFCYVRRRSDAMHGFIALLLPLITYTSWDATWARGYGLLLGFSAAALLCWQLATDGVRRSLVLPALSLSLAGAVSCHYYGLYSAGALIVGQAVRDWTRKRLDGPVFTAILVGITPLVTYIPLLKAVKQGSANFWVKPMFNFLVDSYQELIGLAAFSLLLFLLLALRVPEQMEDWTPIRLHVHEVGACVAFLAMPLVIFVAAEFSHVAFWNRYVQPVVIGFVVAVSLFAYRVGGGNRGFRSLAVSIVVWLCFTPWFLGHLIDVARPEPWTLIRQQYDLPETVSLPLVIDSDYVYMVAYHYAPEALRAHLFYLQDREATLQFLGADTGERSMQVGQTFHDFHIVPYNTFVREHPKFLVARPRAGSAWILQKLLQDGADVHLEQLHKPYGNFVEDHMIFVVKPRIADQTEHTAQACNGMPMCDSGHRR